MLTPSSPRKSDDRPSGQVSAADVEAFRRDGVVVLRGVFAPWITALNRGADRNSSSPSHRSITHRADDRDARFLEDFSNWERILEYRQFIEESPMAAIGAALMGSARVQFFHDHYLDKAASSNVPTPWHQDMPYYFVDGRQTVSFWVPLDARSQEVSLRCVVGSHRWPRLVRPTRWSSEEGLYADESAFMDLPDIDAGDYDIRSWSVEPGDAIAFDFKVVHGANANRRDAPSRTVSFRLLGDDVRFIERKGVTSPSYPDIGQTTGERLRADWFPIIFER